MPVSLPLRTSWTLAASAVLALTWTLAGPAARAGDLEPGEARLRADVAFLAADAREGRAPGTPGIEAAAEYIAASFKEMGLTPASGAEGYFQTFNVRGQSRLEGQPELAFRTAQGKDLRPETSDFTPLALGGSANLKGLPVAFAGYGVVAREETEPKVDYDDFAGLDVKGKALLLIRRVPMQGQKDSPFAGRRFNRYAEIRHKATNAFQRGAEAILLVNDGATLHDAKDALLPFQYGSGELMTKLPVFMVTRAFADSLLTAAGAPRLEEVERQINADGKPHSRVLEGLTLTAKSTIERTELKTRNVIGVLEGSGPQAEETIVVGGHYDHLGRGGLFSGSLSMFSRDIHNGADDNASGTATVMELARRMARRRDPLPRRLVFMAFSGEEKGLLGSRHYVEHPLYPLDKTVMMLNFDMVGRLSDKSELTFFGVGSSPGLPELVEALGGSAGFQVKKTSGLTDGIGGSDHESFYQKGVPVLFAFTGTHKDYHRPSDDVERINFAGMSRIADLGELILLDLARRPRRPEYLRPKETAAHASGAGGGDPGRLSVSAYVGSMPDYDDSTNGVKLAGVRDGSPAEKGGLKAGDVIVGFAGRPVATIYDYTESLGRHKPGDEVEVVVRRGGREVTLRVTLGRRPSD